MKWTDFEKLEEERDENGYRVQWDTWDGEKLTTDLTPEMDEDPFPMEHKGWTRAARIKKAIPEAVNIRVVTGDSLTPVDSKRLRPFAPPFIEEVATVSEADWEALSDPKAIGS